MPTMIPLALAAICAPASAVSDQRTEAYRSDLKLLVEELPRRHIDPFTKVTRERWLGAAAALEARLPEIRSDGQFVIALKQLVALIGDGHSDVTPPAGLLRDYPLMVHLFPEGPVVIAAPRANEGLIGSRISRIGATPFEEAAGRIATVFPAENDSSRKVLLASWMLSADALHTLGMVDDPARAPFTLVGADGTETVVELSPAQVPAREWVVRPSPDDRSLPVSRQRRPGYYWSEPLPDARALYICYVSCREQEGRPFAEFAREALGTIDAGGVDRVIIDLRRNGGGNSAIMRPLVSGLAERPIGGERGRVLVLIGRRTFSSAQLNARELRDRCKGVLIGEPTGQKPNAFGEVRTFPLPGTGATVRYSTKRFVTDPADPPSMMPDEVIEPTSADHFAGRDPVFERALSWEPVPK